MLFLNTGGAFALGGGGAAATGVTPTYTTSPAVAQQSSGGVTGILKTLVGKIDFGAIFGQSPHEREHIARVSGLYDRAIAGDATAYAALVEITVAKWPGQPDKWLRPQHERDLAARALSSLRTNTEFVTTVATNPAYAELRKVAQDIRDDLATAIGRIGAGATQSVVDAVGGPNGASTGGAVLPLSKSQLVAVVVVGGALVWLAVRNRGS
jgi:hypothetical protein